MSSLIVEVCKVNEIKPHPNADKLEIAVVKGWECCVQKGQFKAGDKCVYFPVDTVLPVDVSDKLGVTKYLSNGRIRATRLRSYPSCGLVAIPDDPSWKVGKSVVDHYKCTKYEPPVRSLKAGQASKQHPLFVRYTDIENIKNFPDVMIPGEAVYITEKIHGRNCRVGLVENEWMAGSHNVQRKDPNKKDSLWEKIVRYWKTRKWTMPKDKEATLYWLPLESKELRDMIKFLSRDKKAKQVIVFCEIFGAGIQDLTYGKPGREFNVIDILVDNKYLDFLDVIACCGVFKIPTVPILFRGCWDNSLIDKFTPGDSVVSSSKQMREGIVIHPATERIDYKCGRVILKSISFEYLERKNGTEDH